MNTAIDPAQRLARWRLILGAQAQERLERMGACGLTEEQLLMDQALGAIYGGDAGADALGRAKGSLPARAAARQARVFPSGSAMCAPCSTAKSSP